MTSRERQLQRNQITCFFKWCVIGGVSALCLICSAERFTSEWRTKQALRQAITENRADVEAYRASLKASDDIQAIYRSEIQVAGEVK